MSESDLIEGLKNGNSQAYEYAYREFFPMVKKYVLDNNGTVDKARDLFQETMIVLINSLRKPNFTFSAKVSSYLYAVAQKTWLYRLRGKKDVQSLDQRVDKEKLIGAVDNGEIEIKKKFEQKHHLAQQVLKTLSKECQQIILLFYYEKKSLGFIREQLDYTQDFIKVKKKRCMDGYKKKIMTHPDFQTLQQ